ncbi:MAG: polysaccharide pyruvyl transferase family protein [Bacteroidota bacterium]
MMHIQLAILHAQNTFNNGSFMMLINFLWYYVRHTSPDARITFWIELDGAENHQRLMRAIPGEFYSGERIAIRRLPFAITSADHSPLLIKFIRLHAKFYSHPRKFKALGIEMVIILGGDDISESYKKWLIISDLYRIYRYSGSFTTVLAGQTMGPFQGFRKRMAGKCLSKTMIFSRDELTAGYLTESLHIPDDRIRRSADLSFPELPVPEGEGSAADGTPANGSGAADRGLIRGEYITLVPGGHVSLYTKDKPAYILSWVHLVRDLLGSGTHLSKKIVFLPHVTRPEDDREIIHLIVDSLSGEREARERFCLFEEELFPHQLRQVLGNSYLTITSRMHAALSAFQRKKPAIALAHSMKYDGVIGWSLKCPELVVHCAEDLMREPDRFSRAVQRKVSYVDQHYKQIQRHLDARIPVLQVMAEDQIRYIAGMAEDSLNR